MALKKQNFAEGEIAIFDEACVYKRGEYWQFRLWLPKENKYARNIPQTKIVKQQSQPTTTQMTAKDTVRVDTKPIRPQPPLSNQRED